jgi:MerR family transcriptional regulator, thiopeptide resistance regulator
MQLKIGELAKRSGVTVRALHHYDSIGLLTPSARSDAGYRLYNRDDIARLHQVQALRRFGVALADIGTFLANPASCLPAIVDQQIAALTRQIDQAAALRGQLTLLQRQLASGEEPELASWLTTLELMNMYDNYFTKEELERLPLLSTNASAEWGRLVAQVRALRDAKVPATDAAAQKLAEQWMVMLERDTEGNADFVNRINTMQVQEPGMVEHNGITPDLQAYVASAFGHWRLAMYRPYLTEDEFAFMSTHYAKRAHEWPGLIARVNKQMDSGAAPDAPLSRQLAQEWMMLFCSYAGNNPATHLKLRTAHQQQPRLMTGTFMTDELLAYVREAITAL